MERLFGINPRSLNLRRIPPAMTDPQWNTLLRLVAGQLIEPMPVGLIVDSPWLPGWAGKAMLDYFGEDGCWFDANLAAARRFPQAILLPGFWAEYGMCTEPSAFGAKCVWPPEAFPTVEKCIADYAAIAHLKKPNCRTDGLPPFVIRRLQRCRPAIEAAGHRIRFATSRGPLNIASYLLGQTDFLVGLKTNPDEIHRLLDIVADFVIDWIGWQMETFDTIDGIFLLDDLIGFLRQDDFDQFAAPYLRRIFQSHPAAVRFLHNDATGLITGRRLAEIGVNMFNFSFNHSLREMREAAGPEVVLVGNVPPRDILALGSPDDVRRSAADMFTGVEDKRRILISCGGGVSPGTPAENIDALCE